NRLIGETDAGGLLLVNRLNPYQRNQSSIDTLRLPADMHIETTALAAVPARRSGVLAAFELRLILAAYASVLDSDGQPLPAGSTLWLETREGAELALIVGHEGMIYLENPAPGAFFR